MKTFGYVVGALFTALGVLLMLGAIAGLVGIHLLGSGASEDGGNGLFGFALAAVPLVIGLVILSKLQGKPMAAQDAESASDDEG